ncbi:MAG: insulinase family protein [Actinomyces sp.]|nr:insulinase family protein [Actinomyces sp.]MDN6566070.1 insulinase family protein [Actinomyces sp.]
MSFADGDTQVRRTTLPQGVRVLTQLVPATRSVGLSLWVPVGSRDETPEHAGSTHFLEHLLFKGTRRRSALDIAVAFDAVGGESNAETGKESTSYWARVVDQDLDMAVDVLTDMVTSSLLQPTDFDLERGVILDELAMAEDSPTEVVHDAFQLAVHGDTPLGRPVGGTADAIRAVERDAVWDHYQQAYGPDSLIVAAAGSVDHDHLLDVVQQALERAGWGSAPGATRRAPRPRRPETGWQEQGEGEVVRHRDVEQAHVVVGCASLRAGDPRRPVMSVLLSLLGGSMSSRLFQEVREKRGLAYSTYAFDAPYADGGAFGMYAGTAPARVREVEDLMVAQLEEVAADGPTEEEMERVRGQVRGGLALGLEDNWSRMTRLGRSEVQGRYLTVAAALARVEAVTPADVRTLAAQLAAAPRRRAVVLPIGRE